MCSGCSCGCRCGHGLGCSRGCGGGCGGCGGGCGGAWVWLWVLARVVYTAASVCCPCSIHVHSYEFTCRRPSPQPADEALVTVDIQRTSTRCVGRLLFRNRRREPGRRRCAAWRHPWPGAAPWRGAMRCGASAAVQPDPALVEPALRFGQHFDTHEVRTRCRALRRRFTAMHTGQGERG